MVTKEHTCCFFGHRKIEVTGELVNHLKEVVEDLIIEKKSGTKLAYDYAVKKGLTILNLFN